MARASHWGEDSPTAGRSPAASASEFTISSHHRQDSEREARSSHNYSQHDLDLDYQYQQHLHQDEDYHYHQDQNYHYQQLQHQQHQQQQEHQPQQLQPYYQQPYYPRDYEGYWADSEPCDKRYYLNHKPLPDPPLRPLKNPRRLAKREGSSHSVRPRDSFDVAMENLNAGGSSRSDLDLATHGALFAKDGLSTPSGSSRREGSISKLPLPSPADALDETLRGAGVGRLGSPALGGMGPGGHPPPPGGGGGGGGPGGPFGDPEKNFKPKSLRFWSIMLSNFMALFLVALDRTIIATAIPRITDDFQSLGDIGWYGSAYMLTTAASQLLFGRIFKFYHIKWTYLIVIVVFEVGSAICAAAPTSAVFIAGRAIAGFGSAGIFTGSMIIMIPMVPLAKRPVFQAIFGMVFGFSSVIGPLIGGAFTGAVNWRWCFWINLPVGGVALIALFLFLDIPQPPRPPAPVKQHILRLDPLGTFFFLPAIVALLLALQWGGAKYAWNDARVVALLVVFVVMFIGFATVQVLMPDTATVPFRIIRQRSMLAGAGFMVFLAGSMILSIYYVPLWFQAVLGVDPVKSGIYTIPLVLSIVVSSIISGAATQKLGYYVPSMLVCPVIMAVGEGLLSTFTETTPSSRWIAYQFLTGFGLGFGMQTVNLAVQTVFPPEDVSTGIAISFFSQQLGSAVFVSVGQTILNNLLTSRLRHIPGLDGGGHVIVESGATELLAKVEERYVPLVVEAYNFACTRVFLTGTGLAIATFLCALGMQWKSIKKAPPGGGPGGSKGAGGGGPGGPGGSGGPDSSASSPLAEVSPEIHMPRTKEKAGLAGLFSKKRGM